MDFKEEIRQFGKRVDRLLPQIKTEEATKTSLIMPFQSILRKDIEVGRVFMRDNQSYCGILLDDNNRKPICRFYFSPNRLRLFDQEKKETKHNLDLLDDIYKYSEEILKTVGYYAVS